MRRSTAAATDRRREDDHAAQAAARNVPGGLPRRSLAGRYAPVVSGLPGLRRHLHCHTRDGAYVFGESSFDSVEQLWFDDVDALRAALRSPYHAERVAPARAAITDPRYVFSLTARENWIIGPGPADRNSERPSAA